MGIFAGLIGILAWMGFLASLAIHLGSWGQYAPWGEGAFLLQFVCIGTVLMAHSLRGFKKKLGWSDCAGPAKCLLVIVGPYVMVSFLVTMAGHHDKHQPIWATLRLFSGMWMGLFLFGAGLAAAPLRR